MRTHSLLVTKLVVLSVFLLLPDCRQTEPKTEQSKQTEEPGSFRVSIRATGFKNQKGKVIALLFYDSKGFPDSGKHADRIAVIDEIPADKSVEFRFSNLTTGTFAVSILHDENGDEQMNRSILGVPQEGYGMTNNPPVAEGAPSFQDALVDLQIQNRSLTIRMNYLE